MERISDLWLVVGSVQELLDVHFHGVEHVTAGELYSRLQSIAGTPPSPHIYSRYPTHIDEQSARGTAVGIRWR
jgi:hypothetical protein